MENAIKKPIQLVMKEMRDSIVNIINASQLPYSIAGLMIKDIYEEVQKASLAEYKTAIQQYNNKLEEIKKESNNNKPESSIAVPLNE